MINNKIINTVDLKLSENIDQDVKIWSTAYMKNKFNFLGVKKPILKAIINDICKNKLPIEEILQISEYWYLKNIREYQYLAIYLLEKNLKYLEPKHLNILEEMIVTYSWWDTVDTLSSNILGIVLLKLDHHNRKKYLQKWEESGNIWLIRLCIIHQLKYKNNTNTDYLIHICLSNKNDKGFFIRKAIGWALREYSKVNPCWVRDFINTNQDLSNLSKKEALKILNKN